MKWLTKSNYQRYRIHPAYLWLTKHAPEKIPQVDESAQARFDAGNALDELARELFPGAHLVDAEIMEAHKVSEPLLANGGPEVLLQPAALTKRSLYARADVMVRLNDAWDIYEVKSATSVKDDYHHDLAFQKLVFEEEGHKISRSFVIHIDSHYVLKGDVDLKKLFAITEVTEAVDALEKDTRANLAKARKTMDASECPTDSPELASKWMGGWQDLYFHLHPDVPEFSILRMTRLSVPQLKSLTEQAITDIRDIPEDFKLVPQQEAQVAVARKGVPEIHHEKIGHDLASLKYPLYFLDYETAMSAIPLWDGTKPYQQVPFQYSLHIIEKPGAEVTHKEYLARGPENPIKALLERMREDIADKGSVVVWYKPFECSRNDEMAAMFPEYAKFLQGVNDRVYDLRDPFANGWYAHPRFNGSSSIKDVLPVLVPGLSYKELEIQKGDVAQLRWMKAALGGLPADERDAVYENLIVYCGQDTLAMVKIFDVLEKEVEAKEKVAL